MKARSLLFASLALSGFLSAQSALASGPSCRWQGASVHGGEWLECPDCLWKFCQCQDNGRWGNCNNNPPDKGACDWAKPDWENPACSEGGSKPCDWNNPDWENPSCADGNGP